MSDEEKRKEFEEQQELIKEKSEEKFLNNVTINQQSIILKFLIFIDKALSSEDKTEIDYWIQRFNMFKNGDNMFIDDDGELGV
jgi:hypothetical protein